MIQKIFIRLNKVINLIRHKLYTNYSYLITSMLFYLNGVNVKSFRTCGIPYIHVSLNGQCKIGSGLKVNNGHYCSESGVNGKCRIDVRKDASLLIGDRVGMSDTSITCHKSIKIGNDTLLGVGCQIRDTDSHSLDSWSRKNGLDSVNAITKAIIIEHDVFIGSYSIILKGVTVGANSIIGAGSIVTKDIPCNQIWGGNPAKYIKDNSYPHE